MLNKLCVDQLPLQGKKVFLRVDFNVPLDKKDRRVADDTRLRASLPTIRYLLEQGARAAMASHLGRPDGKVVPEMSLKPVVPVLSALLGREVGFVDDCVGPLVEQAVEALAPGSALLLENLRFHKGETKNDPQFAALLARGYDLYVNDAFGTAHRAHASTVGMIPHFRTAACGFLMKKEIDYLGNALDAPRRPFVALLGGAKVSDKIPVIEHLMGKLDALLIGGGMAYTFLRAQGHEVGGSLLEEDRLDKAREILGRAAAQGLKLLLPVDHLAARSLDEGAEIRVVETGAIPEGWICLDIGPTTVSAFTEELRNAGTVLWNGPMGVFEKAPFAEGTMAMARALAESSAVSIIGGGDSVAAVAKAGVSASITHISTGGGASLELLAGDALPGVVALTDAS